MKKLAIGVLVLVFLLPAPAEALFGSECRSLKKRTQANQIKYEKAWDKYQVALAQWKTSVKSSDSLSIRKMGEPTFNRFQETGKIQQIMLDDFVKNSKCLTQDFNWIKEQNEMKKFLSGMTIYTLYYGNYFSTIWDYKGKIK
jgi:hypothetical protein